MSHESTELVLHADNTFKLHEGRRKAFVDNLLKKKNSGKYDSAKSVKLWEYYAEASARDYAEYFGGKWSQIFPPSARREAARDFRDAFEDEYAAGMWAQRQREVETKAQRSKRMKAIAAQLKKESEPAHIRAEGARLRREKPLPGLIHPDKLEAIWKKTHKDYKSGRGATRSIMILRDGGTTIVPLTGLTVTEVERLVPKDWATRVRTRGKPTKKRGTKKGQVRKTARRAYEPKKNAAVHKAGSKWMLMVGGKRAACFSTKREAAGIASALNEMTLTQARKEVGLV